MLAFSAYGPLEGCTPHVGYVKLNGTTVWEGSWCGNTDNNRGVNTILIDPFICSTQETRHFDTHYSLLGSTQLINYLQQVDNGSIIVVVSADEPTRHLSSDAKSTLRLLGADVSDVQFRGSFGFIAQKNFPAKTALRKALTEADSNSNPAQVIATITGIHNDVTTHWLFVIQHTHLSKH